MARKSRAFAEPPSWYAECFIVAVMINMLMRRSLLAVRLLTLTAVPAFVVVVLAAGCDSTALMGGPDGSTTCTVGGTVYEDGATGIKASDGCNTCSCTHGQLACTLLGCPTDQVCGGLQGLTCGPGSYCNFLPSARCGAADATGLCAPIPQTCTQQYAPVCACDGHTYGNACAAAGAGTSVVSDGACAPAPGSCAVDGVSYPDGTSNIPAADGCNICDCVSGALRCTLRACPVPRACGARAGNTCTANEYCAYTEGSLCGAADAEAICKPRPNLCSTVYAPVCGCDGQTHANSCAASLAGSGVLHAGPCAGSGRSCVVGGVTYPDGAGNIPAADGCNVCSCADGALACTKKACPAPRSCGGFAGLTCDATEYCAYVEGQLCGATDASAFCMARPNACDAVLSPVCGCDGKTYPNACAAALAGFGYVSQGACPR